MPYDGGPEAGVKINPAGNQVVCPDVTFIDAQHVKDKIELVRSLILSEVNIKEIDYISGNEGILVKKIKPNYKTLGPKYSKLMKQIAAAVAGFTDVEINILEQNGGLHLNIEEQDVHLCLEDVEIITDDIPGWVVTNSGNLTIALDITISPELLQEGIAREIVNRIQNMRKDNGFDIIDKIHIEIEKNNDVIAAVENNYMYICSETLAEKLVFIDSMPNDVISIALTDEIQTKLIISKVL